MYQWFRGGDDNYAQTLALCTKVNADNDNGNNDGRILKALCAVKFSLEFSQVYVLVQVREMNRAICVHIMKFFRFWFKNFS